MPPVFIVPAKHGWGRKRANKAQEGKDAANRAKSLINDSEEEDANVAVRRSLIRIVKGSHKIQIRILSM